jgi:RNA polymerase primary sigma factor
VREPLTFQAIIIWRDELNEGKVFLRDIIDLDATHAGPDESGFLNTRHDTESGDTSAASPVGCEKSMEDRSPGSNSA